MSAKLAIRMVMGAVAGLLMLAPSTRAQSISPVIVEYREQARGTLVVTNDTLYPLDVVLEPFSFSVNESGNPTYRILDPEIRVTLSATSFRLGPKQRYTVYYEARTEVLPAWFTIYATVTKSRTNTPLKVAYQLPHTVYLLPKRNLERDALAVRKAEAAAQGSHIAVELENRGAEFGRVLEVEVDYGAEKKTYSGFPFFPHQRRSLLLERNSRGEPRKVTLKFANFKVEAPIRVTSP